MGDNAKYGYFVFGPYRLYPVARVLRRGEATIAVGSRAFDILVALVERQGQVLSRRELMALAWPGLNVEDSNVRVQMAHLRREIHCGENGERYVASVAGRGYCFVAPVEWYDASPNDGVNSAPARPIAVEANVRALPAPLERPLGRDENLAALMLAIEERRFVTVVGAGGVGKTTLVILAAHRLTNFEKTYFVDLSSAEDEAMVIDEIAGAMGFDPQQDILPVIIEHLSRHRTLLIMDNCEHVLDEVSDVISAVLKHASDVHLVATSREALRLPGEAVYLLRPLGVPPHTGRLSAKQAVAWPAVQLFMERAIDGGYPKELDDEQAVTVAAICRRLDGNPLAIELVASRIGSYGLDRVSELLDNQLALCWRGNRYAPARHQTVQSMLDWSYEGLSEIDQTALRRLSIFSGEFSLDAALAVVSGSGIDDAGVVGAIGNLVDKSLLVLQPGTGPAQLRLSGITKTYAAAKLAESGERAFVDQRHMAYQVQVLRQPIEDGDLGTDQIFGAPMSISQ